MFVLNVVDGCRPSDLATGRAAEIEKERRLLYVAMPRARDHLHLMVPQRFYVHQLAAFGDKHVYGSLTRFIPPAVAGQFELVSPEPATGADPHGAATAPMACIDIASQVRSLWR